MPPNIYEHSTGVCVDRTKQRAQRVVQTDNKNRRTERLQVLRHKTHPKLFASANDKDGDEEDDQIALEPEKTRDARELLHAQSSRCAGYCARFADARHVCCSGESESRRSDRKRSLLQSSPPRQP